jgi:NAD(P)-dependent dehydrogenase (short-subunit alcohol dehydrogenase family)
MKNVAMEVAPHVNINATAQTYVDNITYWPMAYRETEEFRERLAENPSARLATGRECARTVLFLAGPLFGGLARFRPAAAAAPAPKAIFTTVRSSRLPAAGRCKNRGAVARRPRTGNGGCG